MDYSSILESVRAGNTEDYKEIILHFQSGVIRYLYRMTGDRDVACDLAQDTFIQAYRGVLKTVEIKNLKAWLYRIATNNSLQYIRRRKIISFVSFESAGRETKPGEDKTEEIAVREALKKIPEKQRTCLVLHFIEGFKYREIAETLGTTEEAVRKQVARGKAVFRKAYEGDNENGL